MGYLNMIVDAHQHFWRIDRGVYDWIDDSISGIKRDYLPTHLAPYLAHLGIQKTILVQASETLQENQFMADLAVECAFIGGIVAWLDLTAPDAMSVLQELAQNPLVKGIRPVLQGIEDSDWVLQGDVVSCLRALPDLGLRFDALIQPRHFKAIAEVARTIPDLAIVVDHAAKPVIRDGTPLDADWYDGMQVLAQCPNVYCKVSGLVTEYGPGWTVQGLQPVVDHLIELFSPSRLMWGSDWPVLELDGSYSQWFDCVKQLIAGCTPAEQANILGGTACRFYGLNA